MVTVSDGLQAQSLEGGDERADDTMSSTVGTATTITVTECAPSVPTTSNDFVGGPVSNVAMVIGAPSVPAVTPIETASVSEPNSAIVIPAGATLGPPFPSAFSGTVMFAGTTGTLKIDDSSNFSGTITGQLAIGDVIDLADITAGANATITYSGNNWPGTLTVSDGTHTANIALQGNYSLANFTASSDGHGGTMVIDPPSTTMALREIDGGPNYFSQFSNSTSDRSKLFSHRRMV